MRPTERGESTPTTPSGTIAARGADTSDATQRPDGTGAEEVDAEAIDAEAIGAEVIDADTDGVADTHPGLALSRQPRTSSSTRSGDGFASSPHRRVVGLVGQIDNYRIIDELGSGGMAVVYRAEDERLRRQVALKILHDHIAGRPENRERFEREARAVARLEHPNIMSVYGFSSPTAPVGYIAAELIEGETLRAFVDRRGFEFPEIGAMVCLLLADALAHAHEQGIIHRDFKPENVMLSRAGVPKLMDFGLARLLDHQTLTMTGAVLGSPAHMSPEAIDGSAVDERVDIFAFGTVLYYAATRRLPFDGRNPAVILNAILSGTYADATQTNPRVGARLSRIIDRCLATDPADRYQTVRELADELREWLSRFDLADAAGELRQFFADPDGYERALEARLVSRLEVLADRAVAERRMASAIAYCDQLLAIREGNAAALRILGNVESRRRVRSWIAGGTVLSLAALLIWLAPKLGEDVIGQAVEAADPRVLAEGAASSVAEEARVTAVAAVSAPAVAAARVALVRAVGIAHARSTAYWTGLSVIENAGGTATRLGYSAAATILDRVPRPQPRLERPIPPEAIPPPFSVVPPPAVEAEPAVPTRRVELNIWPPPTTVRIDGRELGNAVDVNQGIDLPVGPHTIELKIPQLQGGRLRDTFIVTEDGRNHFSYRVEWPPAYVTFDASRRGSVVFEGRSYSTDDRVEVAIGEGGPNREIELVFLPPVGEPTRMTVTVRTEQEIPVRAPF